MVFSTPVEVFLCYRFLCIPALCFLHASGGVSLLHLRNLLRHKFSPRQWRCFQGNDVDYAIEVVFSTPVEVFLSHLNVISSIQRFLHASGGVSDSRRGNKGNQKFSPRQWRCFSICDDEVPNCHVFSTPVEVFLEECEAVLAAGGFLHASGGVSWYN